MPSPGDTLDPAPHRKRMKRREIPGNIRFITFSCERRLPILGTPITRDIVKSSLRAARHKFQLELFAWVLMPEHVHLLVRPANGSELGPALKSMKLSATQHLLAHLRRTSDPLLPQIILPDGTPRVWQKGGGFDRNVRHDAELQKEVRYIHRNPVVKGLAERPVDWVWSSARWWTSRHDGSAQDSSDLPCDWPPGDPRAWAMWRGFA